MMLILAYRGEEEYKRLLKDSTAAQEKQKSLVWMKSRLSCTML